VTTNSGRRKSGSPPSSSDLGLVAFHLGRSLRFFDAQGVNLVAVLVLLVRQVGFGDGVAVVLKKRGQGGGRERRYDLDSRSRSRFGSTAAAGSAGADGAVVPMVFAGRCPRQAPPRPPGAPRAAGLPLQPQRATEEEHPPGPSFTLSWLLVTCNRPSVTTMPLGRAAGSSHWTLHTLEATAVFTVP
jgi:hypothetical protein